MSVDKKLKGKNVNEFRSSHDKAFFVPKRIKESLAVLGESWEYEADFIRRCRLSNTDFARFRDEFIAFCVETSGRNPKRVWAGTVAFAAQLRSLAE